MGLSLFMLTPEIESTPIWYRATKHIPPCQCKNKRVKIIQKAGLKHGGWVSEVQCVHCFHIWVTYNE